MNADAARLAAYADLVAAVLDLRSPDPAAAFDTAVADAVADGRLPEDLARQLRWLQRESERAVVAHGQAVLPAALLALDHSAAAVAHVPLVAATPDAAADPSVPLASAPGHTSPPPQPTPQPLRSASPEPDALPPAPDQSGETVEQPVDLQARRLLVAGLRHLPDHAHRGTPS